jgi:hypothetical protein
MMPTTQYNIDNNKMQFIAAPQMLPMPAPVMFMPQMVPAAIPFAPAPLPTIPMLPITQPALNCDNSLPLFYDGSSFTQIPQNLQSFSSDGVLVPPPGYSFVTMSAPTVSVERSVSPQLEDNTSSELLPLPQDSIRSRSRSSSVVSIPEEVEEVKPVEKTQNKKFRHRSKQTRILEVHQKLKEEYTAKGLYAGDDEVLRGFDTVRVHVKTYKALNRIECPLNDVEKHPAVEVLKIATPFSMKNRFQKKGFIVYLKLASVDMVPIVQEIFSHYKEDFAKCDVALKKEDKLALDRARAEAAQPKQLSDAPEFLSARAYNRDGFEFSDWATSGMAA